MSHRNRSETILYVIDEQALARQDLEQSFSDQGQEQQRRGGQRDDGAVADLERSLELLPTAPAHYALGDIAKARLVDADGEI